MIKQTLFTCWHFMRWLRLGLGVFMAIQAVQNHDTLSGLIGAFFLLQAVTNTGCCGVSSCATPATKNNADKIEEVEFEEVKTK
ncbi:MAG: hypothetical protein HYU69_07360 [Bacteroidetes bacterium]|nr:hypothetical protein [Bacteroidota bacterium]